MALSDARVRQANATGKHYTPRDIDGLSLAVSAAGPNAWHFLYTWLGRQRCVNYQITTRTPLAINLGNRGRRAPDRQFDPPKHQLVRAVMRTRRSNEMLHLAAC